MARARVLGFQGSDYSAADKVVACAKHWVAYGAAEGGRDYNTTDLSEITLREVYFPPFKAALDAGVGTFMSAFNDLNGVPTSANPFTLTRVLRGEWKFDGIVVSDYESVKRAHQPRTPCKRERSSRSRSERRRRHGNGEPAVQQARGGPAQGAKTLVSDY